jgi:hypothetical protein
MGQPGDSERARLCCWPFVCSKQSSSLLYRGKKNSLSCANMSSYGYSLAVRHIGNCTTVIKAQRKRMGLVVNAMHSFCSGLIQEGERRAVHIFTPMMS